METTYRGSLRPIIVFRNTGGGAWTMLNAGKGTAINVDVFDGDQQNWDRECSVRYSAVPVGKDYEVPLKFLKKGGKLLRSIWTRLVGSSHPNASIRPTHRLRSTNTPSSWRSTNSGNLIPTPAKYGKINSRSAAKSNRHPRAFRASIFQGKCDRYCQIWGQGRRGNDDRCSSNAASPNADAGSTPIAPIAAQQNEPDHSVEPMGASHLARSHTSRARWPASAAHADR